MLYYPKKGKEEKTMKRYLCIFTSFNGRKWTGFYDDLGEKFSYIDKLPKGFIKESSLYIYNKYDNKYEKLYDESYHY